MPDAHVTSSCNEDVVFEENLPPGMLSLPSPDVVRQVALESGNRRDENHSRPPPVRFSSLQLLVKYGADVSVVEGHCLVMIRRYLPQVPVPKVYGWRKDQGQGFIYMELVEGQTLMDRWDTLGDEERITICQELQGMVKAWRELPQDLDARTSGILPFIGNVCGGPLLDWIFIGTDAPTAGPFQTVSEFHDYYTLTIGPPKNKPINELSPHPYRHMLPDDVPIVFTHADLHPSNIIVSRSEEGGVRVVSIIDWQQSGWYPAYWEYCKACWTAKIGEPWRELYVPSIIDSADCYDYWDYFVLARGR